MQIFLLSVSFDIIFVLLLCFKFHSIIVILYFKYSDSLFLPVSTWTFSCFYNDSLHVRTSVEIKRHSILSVSRKTATEHF